MEMSADRLATIAQGVVHVVGTSSPDMVASAPARVDAMLMFSVVPRVTDAQPPSATLPISRPDCARSSAGQEGRPKLQHGESDDDKQRDEGEELAHVGYPDG